MYSGDRDTFTFDGYVKIRMLCEEATTSITLHMWELNITDGTLKVWREGDEQNIFDTTTREDVDRQFLVIQVDRSLEPGQHYFVEMRFEAPLKRNGYHGFFLGSFKQDNNTM